MDTPDAELIRLLRKQLRRPIDTFVTRLELVNGLNTLRLLSRRLVDQVDPEPLKKIRTERVTKRLANNPHKDE